MVGQVGGWQDGVESGRGASPEPDRAWNVGTNEWSKEDLGGARMPVAAQLNVTPDGFCNHDDVAIDDRFMAFAVQCLEGADRLLLGRKTYDLFVAYWPAAARNASLPEWEQTLARSIDAIDKVVVSRSMTASDWGTTSVLADLDEDSARALSMSGRTLILGSPSLIAQFAEWGLLDELMLSVHPVMGRDGMRLFDGSVPAGMFFDHQFPSGSAVTTYRFVSAERRGNPPVPQGS